MANNGREEAEAWTDTETMLRGLVCEAEKNRKRSVSGYQWAICVIFGILTFVLGIQCQNERLSTTVIKTEARVTAVENDIRDLKNGITWLQNNAATKDDVQKLAR